MFTVKEVSKTLDLSEHTIRYYTDAGLIPGVKKDKNNNRLFDDEAVECLSGVKYLIDCGMPLNAVKEYMELCRQGDSTMEARYQLVQKQLELAQNQAKEGNS